MGLKCVSGTMSFTVELFNGYFDLISVPVKSFCVILWQKDYSEDDLIGDVSLRVYKHLADSENYEVIE